MKKDVAIKIGSESYTLYYDNAAISRIEEITGKSIFYFLDVNDDGQMTNMSISFLMAALACGLAKHHKNLAKTARIKEMTDPFPHQMGSYVEAIVKGIMLWQGADPKALEAAIASRDDGKNDVPAVALVEATPEVAPLDAGSRS